MTNTPLNEFKIALNLKEDEEKFFNFFFGDATILDVKTMNNLKTFPVES